MYLNITGRFAYNEALYVYSLMAAQYGGTALNLFTLWVIFKYSTIEMRSFRAHLLLYQVASATLDFGMDTLAKPIFFFPYVAGASQGWLHTILGLNSYWVFVFMVTFAGFCVHVVCFHLLYYRWQMILPETSKLKIKSAFGRGMYTFSAAVIANGFYYFVYSPAFEEVDVSIAHFVKRHPEDANLANVDGFYYVNTDDNNKFFYALCFQMSWMVYLICTAVGFTYHCVYTLNALREHMSESTRRMHFRFLRNLFIQTTIPLLLLQVPLWGWVGSIVFDVRFNGHQNLSNFFVWCMCVHGVIASFFLLFLNRCYYEGCVDIFVTPIMKIFCKNMIPHTRIQNSSSFGISSAIVA